MFKINEEIKKQENLNAPESGSYASEDYAGGPASGLSEQEKKDFEIEKTSYEKAAIEEARREVRRNPSKRPARVSGGLEGTEKRDAASAAFEQARRQEQVESMPIPGETSVDYTNIPFDDKDLERRTRLEQNWADRNMLDSSGSFRGDAARNIDSYSDDKGAADTEGFIDAMARLDQVRKDAEGNAVIRGEIEKQSGRKITEPTKYKQSEGTKNAMARLEQAKADSEVLGRIDGSGEAAARNIGSYSSDNGAAVTKGFERETAQKELSKIEKAKRGLS